MEKLKHYGNCTNFFHNMCKDRKDTYRICALSRCCGICINIEECKVSCQLLDIEKTIKQMWTNPTDK